MHNDGKLEKQTLHSQNELPLSPITNEIDWRLIFYLGHCFLAFLWHFFCSISFNYQINVNHFRHECCNAVENRFYIV